jgi:uncharacterized protein YlxW (UPF0749 family)
MQLWNNMLDYFNTQVHRDQYDSKIVGRVGGQFIYDREEIHARIRREAETRIQSLDHREEVRRVIGSSLNALQQSFGLGAGAVGLGIVLTSIFTTALLDVTGISAATLLFTASFFILPYKRKRAIEEFRSKVDKLRESMRSVFEDKSAEEINRAIEKIEEALEPYTRFVKSERSKIEDRSTKLSQIVERLSFTKREIENLVLNK